MKFLAVLFMFFIVDKLKKGDTTDHSKIICINEITTGTDEVDDDILSLTIVDGNNNILFNTFVSPLKVNEWDESKTNGISKDDVKDIPSIIFFQNDIEKILDNANVYIGKHIHKSLKFLHNAGISIPNKKTKNIF